MDRNRLEQAMNLADFYASRETEDTSYQRAMVDQQGWEADPDRWKTDLEDIPDQGMDPGNPDYHQHPMQYLSGYWKRFPFSDRFEEVLNRLHGVWVKDQDPRALAVQVNQEGETVYAERVQTPSGQWRYLEETELRAWTGTKVMVMVELVAKHLGEVGQLTQTDQQTVTRHRAALTQGQRAQEPNPGQ